MIGRLKRIVQYNFMAKALSLLASIILWAIVMNEQNPTIEWDFDLPLNYGSMPKGYKVTRSADHVHVKVRGKRSTIMETDTNQFHAELDLNGLEEGTFPVPVRVKVPQGIEEVEINPQSVDVTLDPFMEKQMRVEIVTTGTPAKGVTLGRVFQENVVITLAGPSSVVSQVARVVGYVSLDEKRDDFSQKVALIPINEEGKEIDGVRVFPSVTGVDVDLARSFVKKNVTIEPVTEANLPLGYALGKITVVPISIEITGEVELVSSLNTVRTEQISLENETATFTRNVHLVLPQGVTVSNSEVTVTVEVKPATAKNVVNSGNSGTNEKNNGQN